MNVALYCFSFMFILKIPIHVSGSICLNTFYTGNKQNNRKADGYGKIEKKRNP